MFVPHLKLTASLIVLAFAAAVPAHAQSIKDAVEQTLKTNPDILIDANRRLSTDEAVKGARGGYLPKLDLGLGHGREWSDNSSTVAGGVTLTRREASLTLRQMLFDGFGVKSEVERNEGRVESAANRVTATSEQVALRAIEAYLEVLRNRELVVLTKDNASVHVRTFDQIKIRSDSGLGRRADLEQVNARRALSSANLGSAEANLRDAEINYLRIVGGVPVNLNKPEAAAAPVLPATVEEAIQKALDNHPTLKSARADVYSADAQTRAAKSTYWPRLDLEIGAAHNRNIDGVRGDNEEQYAMLRMRYSLFNGGSDVARVNETVHLASEAREIMSRTQRQVEQSTRLSWNAYQSAQSRLPSLREHADFSGATRDAYTKQFSIGQRTLLDMLDAENEYYTASTNYVNGQYIELFARYRILADLGELLNALGVAPREESKLTQNQTKQ